MSHDLNDNGRNEDTFDRKNIEVYHRDPNIFVLLTLSILRNVPMADRTFLGWYLSQVTSLIRLLLLLL